ncbi:MAG TPA: tetratricopeptide repeat protein [Polyangia bacterium]|nr:tetratricopeptide repeat protein [Polyangia bacterium]
MTARIAMALLLGLLSVATMAPVAAPTAQAADGAPESESAARELFRKAEISFNLGKFPEALRDYQAAYEAKPLPGFLFNIAQCYRHMGNYERARFFYRRYLALDPKTPNRRLVTDLITEVTQKMDSAPTPGAAPAAADATTPAAVVATSPADTPALALTPAAAASATATATPPSLMADPNMVTTSPAPTSRPVYKRWWFWTGIAAVVAGGVVATVLLTRSDPAHGTLTPIDGR